MIIIYVMTKKLTTDHHVKEIVDSMSHRKNVEVYNENR